MVDETKYKNLSRNPDSQQTRDLFCQIRKRTQKMEVLMERFMVQEHKGKGKASLLHDFPRMQQSALKTITPITTILEFQICSQDVQQAHLELLEKII